MQRFKAAVDSQTRHDLCSGRHFFDSPGAGESQEDRGLSLSILSGVSQSPITPQSSKTASATQRGRCGGSFHLLERARQGSIDLTAFRVYARAVWGALVSEIGNVFSRFSANAQTRSAFRQLIDNHVRSRRRGRIVQLRHGI